MSLHRLACSAIALSLLGGIATAKPYRYEDDLAAPPPAEEREFAKPVLDRAEINPDRIPPDRAKVRAALAARRADNLARFRAYRSAGVFPHNFVTDDKLNVWLDDEGHLCAAATIISMSGMSEQVMQQADANNFIRLVDVEDGWLMDWMLTSGLTQEELVLIQEPFMGRMQPIDPIRVEPVDDPQRIAEDRRLKKRYARVDRTIVKQRKKSLEIAVDRLMAHPDLARALLAES